MLSISIYLSLSSSLSLTHTHTHTHTLGYLDKVMVLFGSKIINSFWPNNGWSFDNINTKHTHMLKHSTNTHKIPAYLLRYSTSHKGNNLLLVLRYYLFFNAILTEYKKPGKGQNHDAAIVKEQKGRM